MQPFTQKDALDQFLDQAPRLSNFFMLNSAEHEIFPAHKW